MESDQSAHTDDAPVSITTSTDREARNQYVRARNSLSRALARRDHSRFELEQKLKRRFDDELVTRVLDEAEDQGLIATDADVAEKMAAVFNRKGKSRRYIEGQLRKRKLPVPPASEQQELEKIRSLVERKFGTQKLSFEERNQAYRFLKYRGFDDRWIRTVINDKK